MKNFFIISLLPIILISCGPRLFYFHLDWLIPWYVSDYISLDSDQKDMLEKSMRELLDWHRSTQLPAYAESLRALGQSLAISTQALDYQRIKYHYDRLLELWQKLWRQIGPDITDILLTASDAQINELFSNLEKRNKEFREKYIDLPPEELNKNRQERMQKNLKYWLSNLTPDQKQAVSDWSSQLMPIASGWLQNREMIQAEARKLLEQRNDSPEMRAELLKLIVNPGQMRSAAFQMKIDYNTDVTIKFFIHLNQLLTPDQRSYLLNRIESLASDFDKLNCDS